VESAQWRCPTWHTRGVGREGAEAIGVTFLMKGGPPRVYSAFCDFADALG